MTDTDAARIDAEARAMVRGLCAGDLAIGRVLVALAGGALRRLGRAKITDYAREVGLKPRLAYQLMGLARALKDRPVLARAVRLGRVPWRKALVVLDVARGDDESRWVGLAMSRTEDELRRAVRDVAGDVPDVAVEVETVWIAMTPEEQDRLDRGIAVARRVMGAHTPRWRCKEAMCQEWLSTHGEDAPPVRAPPRAAPPDVARQLAAAAEAEAAADEPDLSRLDARALDALLRRLVDARRAFEAAFCPLALEIVSRRVWRAAGCASLDRYARERLGMCARGLVERARLEERMRDMPELRAALASGRLSYVKALYVSRQATTRDVAAHIARAAATTAQQVQREADAAELAANRARGRRRLWGPEDVMRTVHDAIASAQRWSRGQGRPVTPGGALALIADHFAVTWDFHELCEAVESPGRRRRKKRARSSGRRGLVLARHGGFCAAPGCSNPAEEVHHILPRARGGANRATNEVSECRSHHSAEHDGLLDVWGEAGRLLVWDYHATGEVYITKGDDDVRRLRVSPERQAWRRAHPHRPWRRRWRRGAARPRVRPPKP